ncbi:MAG: hypothetical protein IH991_10005 [Planctomycetes bacterium]|nr:hypothetical protein [Planctomycetota bacterium]
MHRFFALVAGLGCLGVFTWIALAETLPGFSVTTIPTSSVAAADAGCLIPQISGELEFQGSLSCTNATCHGNLQADTRPGKIRRNEYFVWSERDPHAKAYDVLIEDWTSDASTSIAKKLGIKSMSEPQFANCLACHSPNRSLTAQVDHSQPSSSPFLSSREGVGCEACHGPSQRWRSKHFRGDWDASRAAEVGMLNTKGNLLARARLCAECHVGSKNREVNHDLIAAGHPMLRFEMSAYMDMMPKHWNERTDREFKLQMWSAGQIASADAALELLYARAQDKDGSWPEFSENNCSSCHHNLERPEGGGLNWRQQRGTEQVLETWGSWYYTVLGESINESQGDESAKQLKAALSGLRKTMNESFFVKREVAQKAAGDAIKHLHAWVGQPDDRQERLSSSLKNIPTLIGTLATTTEKNGLKDTPAVRNWDVATQVYLAVLAHELATQETRSKSIKKLHAALQPGDFGSKRDEFLSELKTILNSSTND